MIAVEQWVLIIGALATLLTAFGVFYTAFKNSKNNQATTKANIDARIDARVDKEMARLEATIEDQGRSLADAHEKLDTAHDEIVALKDQLHGEKRARDAVEVTVAKLAARNEEIIAHVLTLEAGYPNPPGPPPRPWKTIPNIN
jgi:septal ring factor EnvC (AmiA/AmiB activator)